MEGNLSKRTFVEAVRMVRTNDATHAGVDGQNLIPEHPAHHQHAKGNASYQLPSYQANGLKDLFNQVIEIQKHLKENRTTTEKKTIFSDVLMNEQIRPEEKTVPHLTYEAHGLIGAGTSTTAHNLSILMYYVIRNPKILERLQSELGTVMSETQPSPKWQQLDRLPFLVRSDHKSQILACFVLQSPLIHLQNAVIHEALR